MADFRRYIPSILATSAFWILAFGAVFLFGLRRPQAEPIEILPPPTAVVANITPEPTSTPAPLRVYVSGAVRAQGVYRLPPNSLVEDAITEAGGAAEDADLIAINLAHPLSDGEQIYVPVQGEADPPPLLSSEKPDDDNNRSKTFELPDEPIDLNTATAEELEALPGVGPKTAALIIQERPYSTVEDLLRVKGIGEKTLEKLRPHIKVE